MLVEFRQNHIFITLLKRLNVPYPSIFTNFCLNYYAYVPCGGKFAKNPSAYLNHLKIHIDTANMFYQQTCQCVCSNAVMSDDMIFFKLHISKITVPYIPTNGNGDRTVKSVPSHGSERRRRVCDGRLALGLEQECFSAAANTTEQPYS